MSLLEGGGGSGAAGQLQRREVRPYVLLALKELSGNPDSRTSSVASADRFACVRTVVRHLARMRSAAPVGWSEEDVKSYLEGLRFTPECVAELTAVLCADEIYASLPTHRAVKPQLAGVQWKIDVSLCQVQLESDAPRDESRVKSLLHRDTLVVLIFSLTDGSARSYRLSVRKFHEVRYSVASMMKSMLVLERRKCMR